MPEGQTKNTNTPSSCCRREMLCRAGEDDRLRGRPLLFVHSGVGGAFYPLELFQHFRVGFPEHRPVLINIDVRHFHALVYMAESVVNEALLDTSFIGNAGPGMPGPIKRHFP